MGNNYLQGLIEKLKTLQSAIAMGNREDINQARKNLEQHVGSFNQFVNFLRKQQSLHGCQNDCTYQAIDWCSDALRKHKRPYPGLWDGLATKEFIAELKRWAASGKEGDKIQATSETTKLKVEAIRDQVFIGYSHKDKRWLDDLQTHLKPYVRNGSVTAWSDKQITPGSKWFPKIEAALASTKVAVLLVTPDFLASDFIHENELGPILKKAEKGKLIIIWVPVRACAYKETPLKDYEAAGDPDKPLANMKAGRDNAWVRICEEIKKAGKTSGR
jgi:hypothetical protein